MSPSRRISLLTALALVLGLILSPAALAAKPSPSPAASATPRPTSSPTLTPSPTPVASSTPTPSPTPVPTPTGPLAGDCGQPVFEYTIDPDSSLPLSPMVQFRESGLGLPAAGRFNWGNGQYGVANLNQVGGGTSFFKQVQPQYAQAGNYTFTSEMTDRCGNTFTVDFPLAVPLSLPTDLNLPCPTTLDVSGFCLVDLGKPVTFTVAGGPDAGWRWDINGPTSGRTFTRTFAATGEFWIQARVLTADGMLVSPILKVAPRSPSKPRITEVHVPDQVPADTSFSASFVIPVGAEAAAPSIYLDAKKIADTNETTLSLPAGTHVITFVLTWPDTSVVSRQAGVISVAPPPPPPPEGPNPLFILGLVLGGGLGLGILVLLLLLLLRWRRRRRTDAQLAAHGRWLRTALRDTGWEISGPAPAGEDGTLIELGLQRDERRFGAQRPRASAKWLWQDLLYVLLEPVNEDALSEVSIGQLTLDLLADEVAPEAPGDSDADQVIEPLEEGSATDFELMSIDLGPDSDDPPAPTPPPLDEHP